MPVPVLVILLLFLAGASRAPGQDVPPGTYYCRTATSPIRIDGRLDEFAWTNVRRVGDFTPREAPDRASPYHTEASLLWDATHLYLAFSCRDPDIWTTKTQRDSNLHQHENVEAFFAPHGPGHPYVELQFNARNVIFDALQGTNDRRRFGKRWNIPGLQSAVQVHGTIGEDGDRDRGWTLEVAMPWRDLGDAAPGVDRPPLPGEAWRFNLYRIERPGGWAAFAPAQPIYDRLNDDQHPPTGAERARLRDRLAQMHIPFVGLMWSPVGGSFHDVARYGHLIFVTDYPPG